MINYQMRLKLWMDGGLVSSVMSIKLVAKPRTALNWPWTAGKARSRASASMAVRILGARVAEQRIDVYCNRVRTPWTID